MRTKSSGRHSRRAHNARYPDCGLIAWSTRGVVRPSRGQRWRGNGGAPHLAQRVQRLAHRVTALGGAEGLDKTWDTDVLEKRLGLRAQRVTREEDKMRQ